jgi:hypothetical protein
MCWDCYDHPKGDPYKMFRQGAVSVEDFDDDLRVRHAKRRAPKARSVRLRGCPGNEGKAHVYVWTSEGQYYEIAEDIFYKHFGFHKKESKVCAGCGRKDGYRLTEAYEKRKEREYRKRFGGPENVLRGEPVKRYGWRRHSFYSFTWEKYDEEYERKVRDYYQRIGAKYYGLY